MMIKFNNEYQILNIISLVITLLLVLFLPNETTSLICIGIAIITFSVLMLFRYRNCTRICLLIGIILMISICFSLSVCLNTYNTAFNWQIALISTSENIINAKNFLLFIVVLYISIGKIKKDVPFKVDYTNNNLIILGGIIILLYALIFGFDRGSVGNYSSNTKVIYEYAIVVFLFVWTYSKDNKFIKIFLLIYALLYCGQGLLFGDRSSAFPMILMLFLLVYRKKYKMPTILLIGLGGILFANAIDIFRNSGVFNFNTIIEILSRGLFVNTISYAFYGGTQVIRYKGILSNNDILNHFLSYLGAFFKGGSSKFSLTVIANAAGYINKGGGMSHVYFYFWGGFMGTITFAIIMGRIINKVFNNDDNLSNILKISITIFVIRWFLYYPVAFFRTALLIPIACYYVCYFFNKWILKLFPNFNHLITGTFLINNKSELKEKNKKENLFIHGSFMNDNYGDFLLYYIIDNICENFTEKFNIFAADVDSSYDTYCNVNRKSKFAEIFNSDVVIFAGGGYFGEPDKRKIYWNIRCLVKHLIPAYIISKRNIPYAIIGVETGPLSFNISKRILKQISDHASVLSVRNNESKIFLEDINVINNILVNPDWVMGISSDLIIKENKVAEDILNNIDSNNKIIFVHLTTRNDVEDSGMMNVIKDLSTFIEEKENVFYIVGCDQKRETQEKRAMTTCSYFPKNKCLLLKYKGPWILSNILSNVDAIITDKLHVGIVGIKCHKEVLSVASHNKAIKFHTLIGRKEWAVHLSDIKQGDILKKLNKLKFEPINIENQIFDDAKNNEKILKDFLTQI